MSKNPQSTVPTETPTASPEQSAKAKKPKARKPKAGTALTVVKGAKSTALAPANAEKLESLAQEIRDSQQSIGLLSKSAKEKISETTAEVMRCGKMLSECKALVGHGGWLKWLDKNCKMSVATAQAYMRVSARWLPNTERAQYLEEPKSIRQAIALLSAGGKKPAPRKDKEGSGKAAGEGEESVAQIMSLAKKMIAVLDALPRAKKDDAFEALTAIRNWINNASIPA